MGEGKRRRQKRLPLFGDFRKLRPEQLFIYPWTSRTPQFIILWGKRRVGKTELVKQFVCDKPHVYFLSASTSEMEQLSRFSAGIGRFFEEPLLQTRGFTSWEESFQYIKMKQRQGKRKLAEIVNTTGLSQPVANKYLGVLSDLKVVERQLPVTVDKPLKTRRGFTESLRSFFNSGSSSFSPGAVN